VTAAARAAARLQLAGAAAHAGMLALALALGACGGADELAPAPAELRAGPVAIETASMRLTVGDLAIERFLSVGVAARVDETHYYDPRGDAAAALVEIPRARGIDGEWIALEGGARLRLGPCEPPGNERPDEPEGCAALDVDASGHARAVQLRIALPHAPGEPAYGTGDAAARANVAGTVRELQLRVDPGSESSLNETHVPVPLVLWPRRGIGVLVADDRPGALDIAASAPDRMTATFTLPARGTYRVYVFAAASPLDLVRRYVALTARPAVPPRWAFAPHQWRNVWASSAEVRADAGEMRARHIPGSVMWIDNPWQTAYNTFVIDEARLEGPRQLLADLAAQGYKVLFWSTPYVGTTSATAADRAEGAASKLFVTDGAGVPIDFPWQDGPGALVDFTRDGAAAWWRERIARVTALGAAGFKLDFGEEVVPELGGTVLELRLAAGDNGSHHARYTEGYHAAYLGALPPGDGFLITRAGAWGEQAVNTAIWPGDLDSDFSEHGVDSGGGRRTVGGLPSAISRGLSLSVSGYPFYGSDIGGFRGFPTTEALLRWAEYAAYGTIMQLGGGGRSHNPWDPTLFAPGADAIYQTYADVHMRLNPWLWTLAQEAGRDGTPITVPARFLHDCACDDAMFLLGGDLLVAPVIAAGATTRAAVLPAGFWIDRNSGAMISSDGRTPITAPAPLAVIPTWQRVGSFIPMFARAADTLLPATAPGVTSYTDRALGRELRLLYAPPVSLEASAFVRLHDGASASAAGPAIELVGGAEYDAITIDIDARGLPLPYSAPAGVSVNGADLPQAADVGVCAAPGCWRFDAATKRLEARVLVPAGEQRTVTVR
jgi:alpha-D-xyloside xylohydrolase